MTKVPNCFYRVSVKALVLNEARDKFLILKEESGRWELPGGGLDWGMKPNEDLPREIAEEMGIKVKWIADNPSYFLSDRMSDGSDLWVANIVYETELEHLKFTPSNECVEVRFVNFTDIKGLLTFPNVVELSQKFRPENHTKQ